MTEKEAGANRSGRLATDGADVLLHYNSRRKPADAVVSELVRALAQPREVPCPFGSKPARGSRPGGRPGRSTGPREYAVHAHRLCIGHNKRCQSGDYVRDVRSQRARRTMATHRPPHRSAVDSAARHRRGELGLADRE